MIGLLTIQLHLPGCISLKQKRSRIRPILARLHQEFNISAAELDLLDRWQDALIGCALVSNDAALARRALEQVLGFLEGHFPEEQVASHRIEIL